MPEVRWVGLVRRTSRAGERSDAEQKPKVVPEAVVRALVNGDVVTEPRHHEAREREVAVQEARPPVAVPVGVDVRDGRVGIPHE